MCFDISNIPAYIIHHSSDVVEHITKHCVYVVGLALHFIVWKKNYSLHAAEANYIKCVYFNMLNGHVLACVSHIYL